MKIKNISKFFYIINVNKNNKQSIIIKIFFSSIISFLNNRIKQNRITRQKKSKKDTDPCNKTLAGGGKIEHSIRYQCINDLKGNGWISTDTIDEYLKIIQLTYKRNNTTIRESMYGSLLQGNITQLIDMGLPHVTTWQGKNIIPCLVIKNGVGYHWILLMIEMEEKNITIIDPIKGMQSYQKEILDKIRKTMNEETTESRGSKKQWTTVINTNHTYQQDGYSCGVYVTDWAENLYRYSSFKDSMHHGKEKLKRKEMSRIINDNRTLKEITEYRKTIATEKQL